MKKLLFQGSAVALVTPFSSSGAVDFFKLKELIEFQIASGTKAIVILGTTGESATITEEERVKIIKFCVCQISKRVPLIVGTGSNSTSIAIKHSVQAESYGADGVLVVSPYYNKCNQNGIFEHYKKIAKSIKIPLILYNVPSRTGLNILPETVLKLSKIKNIIGIKEASGNMTQITKLLQILPSKFAVFSGDDLITFSMMCLGAKGVISVTANAYPDKVSAMCDFILSSDYVNALRIHKFLYEISTKLFLDVNPICIKFYMNLLGKNVGQTRLPLTPPSKEIQKILTQTRSKYEN